eukprot:scaffold3829_cov108-Skeletonema_dohrnii-CCMP3373.AAC.4
MGAAEMAAGNIRENRLRCDSLSTNQSFGAGADDRFGQRFAPSMQLPAHLVEEGLSLRQKTTSLRCGLCRQMRAGTSWQHFSCHEDDLVQYYVDQKQLHSFSS